MFNKLAIFDGSYFLHRAMKQPNLEELKTSKGIKSGGIYGFMRMFQSEVKKFPDYFPVVCFDNGLSKRRTTLFPDYKANRRRKTADNLLSVGVDTDLDEYIKEYHKQRNDIIRLLKSFGIPSLLLPGMEGDDLQYLLTLLTDDGIVFSDDKDMIQLVSPKIKIRRPMRDEMIVWNEEDTYYHHPRFTIRKSIIGDPSDNIPKVAQGIGEKWADKISLLICDIEPSIYKDVLLGYVSSNSEKDALAKRVNLVLDNWKQFEINYQLTDLHLVEFPDGFSELVSDMIRVVSQHSSLMEAYKVLGMYEMNTIFPDQILNMINKSSKTILEG